MAATKTTITTRQAKVLRALKRAKGPLTRNMIGERISSTGEPTSLGAALGRVDEEKRAALEEEVGYPSLLTLGYVKMTEVELDGGLSETVYAPTARGLAALEKFGPISNG
jgi:hypothetical protein